MSWASSPRQHTNSHTCHTFDVQPQIMPAIPYPLLPNCLLHLPLPEIVCGRDGVDSLWLPFVYLISWFILSVVPLTLIDCTSWKSEGFKGCLVLKKIQRYKRKWVSENLPHFVLHLKKCELRGNISYRKVMPSRSSRITSKYENLCHLVFQKPDTEKMMHPAR
jgi:hypothetical protein